MHGSMMRGAVMPKNDDSTLELSCNLPYRFRQKDALSLVLSNRGKSHDPFALFAVAHTVSTADGPPQKVERVTLNWSMNKIETQTILPKTLVV